jgi:hypothetical protein
MNSYPLPVLITFSVITTCYSAVTFTLGPTKKKIRHQTKDGLQK